MTSLLSASSSDLAAQARRLVHGVLRPRDDYDPLPPLRAFPLYAALSGPARAEVLEAQSELHDPDDDVEFMTIALAHDCPNGAVDHAASLLLRSWRDPSGRERLGWSDWRVLLNTKYRALWDAAQVRAVAALASDETSVLGEVVAAALSRGDVDRDRIHNVVHFLAEQQPQLVARTTLSLPAAALREAAGTFAVLTRTVAPSIGRTDRYALIERLKAYAPHDPRRVWPAIARSALSEPSLVASVLDEIAGTQEGPVRRSTFDACLSELDFNGRVQHRDRLRALVRTAEPRDRERRARLDGYLAMADATARANVLALMGAAPAAREPLAAAGALEKVLATWSKPLDAEASAWLLDILCSQHEHVVRTIAQCLARRITIFAWDSIAIARVLERHGQSLAWHEDAQVAAALKAIFTSLFHCDEPLLRELVRADLVHTIIDHYFDAIRRRETSSTSSGSTALTPALYVQLQQAITALALNVLPQSAIESYVSELLIEVDTATIAGRSTRALASTLVAFTDRYPHRWDAVVDTAWEQMPAANKGAVAECLSRGSVPDARTRAKRIVGGGSCPREVAELLLKAFPD